MEENDKHTHITSYVANGTVLVVLLFLTFLSVFVAEQHLGALTITVALGVACIKGITVILNFMHLKHESRFMKFMVLGVFVLFAIVLIITFIDYSFR